MRFSLLAVAGMALALAPLAAAPPAPPAEFAQPQSPAKPTPFEVKLVDQGQFDPRLKGYLLPEGFRLEIVATDPAVVNPVGMTFGPDGTLYVMEWRQDPVNTTWHEVKETFRYRDGSTRQVATMKKFVTDWVKQLKYDPQTKTFGEAKAIIAEELPSSLLYHDGWLYTSGRGTVRRYRQSLPNGKWDVREVIAQGFCGFHHHQVSGLTIGNDGLLYITSGDDDNVVEGSDGSRATAFRTGAVFRCQPDGSKMEVYSLGYRNPYRDAAFDDRFNLFHTDNDNEDGSKFMGCRIMHVAEGSDYGWRLREGVRCCRPDNLRGAIAGELPGRLPPMIKTGRGAPAGLLIYNDTRVPEHYRGLHYYPDVFRKLVRAYAVEPDGSSFKITGEFEFLKSDDPLFRPCQMVAGPDGAIYVCDWRTDSGGAGKLWGDGIHGRIYRIRWAGTADTAEIQLHGLDSWGKIAKLDDAKLIETLAAADFTDRVEARKELVRRGAKVRDAVRAVFADMDQPEDARIMALGVLLAAWDAETETAVRKALRDISPDVRRLAADAIGLHSKREDEKNHTALLQQLTDAEPAVRRAAALALGRVGGGGAAEALVNTYKSEQTPDPFLFDAYIRGLERLGKRGIEAVLNVGQSGNNDDLALALRIFAALREQAGAEALPELLAYPHLTPAQRETLVRSYANYQLEPPISLDPLAAFLAKRPEEPANVVQAAVEVFGTTSASAGKPTRDYLVGLLSRGDVETRLMVIQAVENTRMKEAGPTLLSMLAEEKREVAERKAILKALRVANVPAAAEAIAALLEQPEPPALHVEALRTLAGLNSKQAIAVAEKLLDHKEPAVQEEAVAVLGATPGGAKLVGERFLAGKLPKNLFPRVTDALHKFAKDPDAARLRTAIIKGGLLLGLEETQKLAALVKSKGDPKKGKELYLNTKLLACATCHKLEGVGGFVGPDLSRVWDTQSTEKLIESILAPSKEMKEGYQTYRLVTAKGQTVTGLKVLETAKDVAVRDASGRDVVVARDEIEELSPSKTSIMPEDAVAQLTFDQFIDLLAFLKSRGEQESLRGTVAEFSVSGPTSRDLAVVPSVVLDDALGKEGGPWQAVPAGPNGLIDLKDAFPAQPAGVHLRIWVYSPKAQTAVAALSAEMPVKAWLNGRPAFEQAPDRAGLKEGRFDLELEEGWNVMLLKAVNGGPSLRLGLRVQGKDLRTTAKPEPPPAAVTGAKGG